MNYVALKSFSKVVIPMVAFLMTFFATVVSIFLVVAVSILLWTYVPPLMTQAYGLLGFDRQMAANFGGGTVAIGLAMAALMFGGVFRAHDAVFNEYWVKDRGGKL